MWEVPPTSTAIFGLKVLVRDSHARAVGELGCLHLSAGGRSGEGSGSVNDLLTARLALFRIKVPL